MFALCKLAHMEQLRAYLEANNIRRSAFAESVGVSKGYVTELLNGSKTPGLQLAVKIDAETCGAVPPGSWIAPLGVSA